LTERKLVWIAYIAVCVLWGSTFLAVTIGVREMPAILFSGMRFLIAGGLILGFALIRKLPFPTRKRDYLDYAIMGLLLLFISNGLMASAQRWIQSGVASLLVATVPLFTALLEYLFKDNVRLNWQGWLGLCIGFTGVGILVMGDQMTSSNHIFGILLLIIASISWAGGTVYSKRLKPTGSVVTHIGIQMMTGGVALTATGFLLGEGAQFHMTITGMWAMAYLILFGSIIGYSSFIYVLGKWPSAKASTYAYVNPIIAVLLGAVILDEKVTGPKLIAMIVILLGVLTVQTSKGKVTVPAMAIEMATGQEKLS
jgi:drug/metabolite transporter (DMT)-like permease